MYLSLDFALLGFLSFALVLILQIALWRFFSPQSQVVWLGLLFFGLPFVGALGLSFLDPQLAPLLFAPALIHGVLAANYIAIYPAFQASSPTIEILNRLDDSPTGLSEEQLAQTLGKALVQDRLEDLKTAGLIHDTSGELCPSRKGALLAKFFIQYRKIVGLPEGVG